MPRGMSETQLRTCYLVSVGWKLRARYLPTKTECVLSKEDVGTTNVRIDTLQSLLKMGCIVTDRMTQVGSAAPHNYVLTEIGRNAATRYAVAKGVDDGAHVTSEEIAAAAALCGASYDSTGTVYEFPDGTKIAVNSWNPVQNMHHLTRVIDAVPPQIFQRSVVDPLIALVQARNGGRTGSVCEAVVATVKVLAEDRSRLLKMILGTEGLA